MKQSNQDRFPTFRVVSQRVAVASARIWRHAKPLIQSLFDFYSPARILTFATIIACLSLYLTYGSSGPRELGVLFIGLALGLTTFAACWFCITSHWIRYPAVLIGLSLIGFLFESDNRSGNFEWFLFLLPFVIAIPIVITVETTKLLKGQFTKFDSLKDVEFNEGIQFSIRHLIIVTTVVAVAFGFWNAFRVSIEESIARNQGQNIARIVGSIGATIATFTVLSIWSILGHWRIYRPFVSVAVGSVAIYATSFLAPSANHGFWIAMFLICWFALIALLVALRIEGYRFVKRPGKETK